MLPAEDAVLRLRWEAARYWSAHRVETKEQTALPRGPAYRCDVSQGLAYRLALGGF
jgi:hypothetical protein